MTFSEFKQTKVFKVLKNKYFIAVVIFILCMVFYPNNNISYYFKVKKQLTELEQHRDFLKEEIKSDSIRFSELEKSMEAAEKFGREKYFMKRANEDIYVIRERDPSTN